MAVQTDHASLRSNTTETDESAEAGPARNATVELSHAGETLDALERRAARGQQLVDALQSRAMPQMWGVAREISAVLLRLEEATTVEDLFRAAPAELGCAAGFDRVLLSTVDDSLWAPQSWWARDARSEQDQAIVASLRGSRLPLAGGMVEAEVVRRRATAHVRDTQAGLRTWAPFSEVARSGSYIVAPIVALERVAGLLHVDTGPQGRALGEADVAIMNQFVHGLGLLLERLALRERLATQTRQIHEALAAAAAAVTVTTPGPVQLRSVSTSPEILDDTGTTVPLPRPEDRLTHREREVFDLLVAGATNAQIADRLVVSETTVKSHVKHILRKLHASNRAQVIAQYLRSSDRSHAS